MSKIQDAIRKLQTSQSNAAPVVQLKKELERPSISDSQVASVIRKGLSEQDIAEMEHLVDGEAFVEFDYDMLRRAGLLAPVNQQRHIADQYRLIKRPLLDNASGRGPYNAPDANLIMVASPLPGDGKTFNCMNLALSMATEKDKSVLLVDADVAKPHISTLFGLENEPGLIDLLTDPNLLVGDLLLKTNIPGLRLLPAGRHDEHATELLASRRMAKMVDMMSKTFPDRVVIFDSPPLLVTSEARVLASLMGQIAMVVCSGKTPQEAVIQAAESLDQEKAVSIILNQASQGFGNDSYGAYGAYGYGSRVENNGQ